MDVALCSPPAILNLSFITVLTFYLRPGPPLPRLLIWRNEKHNLQYPATPTTDLVPLTSLYSWAGELVTPVNLETQRQPNENTMVHMLTLTSWIYVLLLTTTQTQVLSGLSDQQTGGEHIISPDERWKSHEEKAEKNIRPFLESNFIVQYILSSCE